MTKTTSVKNPDKASAQRVKFREDEAKLPWLSLLLDAYAVIDKGIAIAISREKRKQNKRLACAEKCAACCRANTDIPVYPLELAGITWYATEKVKQPLRDSMQQQLSAQYASPPCPFLIDSICSVYPVRPIACRQYIVLGRPCSDDEDPYHNRREEVLTPLQDFTNQAIFTMLPFYGITGEAERQKAIQNRFIHTKVQNIFSCNWKSLAETMRSFDLNTRKEPLSRKELNQMTYIEIIVTASEETHDALINKMSEMGAIGFVQQDGGLIGYFEPNQSPAEMCDELGKFRSVLEASGLNASFSLSHTVLPEKDWNETWKKNFTPIDVGDTLTIMPSWLQSATSRIPIIIDPGMVFGTGHHETTRTCLSLIEKIARVCSKRSFLDIGTGTGILAIGAARLGFEQVTAIDIEPLAVDAAQRNAAANSLTNIKVLEGTIQAVSGSFDLIAANLLVEILIEIAAELSDRLEPDGRAILSGLLIGQENSVIEAMTSAGLTLQEKIIDGTWVSLVMVKQRI